MISPCVGENCIDFGLDWRGAESAASQRKRGGSDPAANATSVWRESLWLTLGHIAD